MESPTLTVETRTLDVPGAVLTYDVRGDLAAATAAAPALMVIGTPMTADGFTTFAGHFDDRPVITYDPRNTGRSRQTSDGTPTPEDDAADVHAIVTALQPELGHPQVDLFGSSGGAINALALVAAHPEDLRVVVAHEPPSSPVLPDTDVAVRVLPPGPRRGPGLRGDHGGSRTPGDRRGARRRPRRLPGGPHRVRRGELGQLGKPVEFAATLREVLA